jgi:hypothetical protein
MAWQGNRNQNSLSPHHLKASENFASRGVHDATNSVPCRDLPPPLRGDAPMRERPHDAGPKTNPYMPQSTRRPVGEPQEMRPPHDPNPHPYNNPAGQKQQANPYMPKRP